MRVGRDLDRGVPLRLAVSFVAALAACAPANRILASPASPTARRIVALAPSCAEILFALGAADRVVAVSDFARDLPEAKGKVLAGGFAPDLERIASLRPDRIVVSKDGTDRASVERLRRLGYSVVVTDGTTLDAIFEDIRRVGAAIGEPERARALVKALAARAAAAEERARTRAGAAPTAVAVIWPEPPIVAGPETFVGDLLRRARLENRVPASAGLWPRVSYETLAAWQPDLLIRPETAENRAAFLRAFAPGGRWSLVPAAHAGRVIVLSGDVLERPGPRLVEALESLVALLAKEPR